MQFDILYNNKDGKKEEFHVMETSVADAMCAFWDSPEGQDGDNLRVVTQVRKKGTLVSNMSKEIDKNWRKEE